MPITSPSSSPIPRTPTFLAEVRGVVVQPSFVGGGVVGPGVGGGGHSQTEMPFFEPRGGLLSPSENAGMEVPAGMEPLAPPLPPPVLRPGPEFVERLARAVADLRRTGERLAEQSSADSLEMALLIARRIIDAELSAGPAALAGLIRSAVRRLGEARKIHVRLCPADAAAVTAAGHTADGPLADLSVARVEIQADPTLSSGDCIVDGELGAVDGRVTVRLEEVRRILTRALSEEGEPPR